MILSFKICNCLVSGELKASWGGWSRFEQTCDCMLTMDCKHFKVAMAWRLTALPLIIACSLTIPFSALNAFLACKFTFYLNNTNFTLSVEGWRVKIRKQIHKLLGIRQPGVPSQSSLVMKGVAHVPYREGGPSIIFQSKTMWDPRRAPLKWCPFGLTNLVPNLNFGPNTLLSQWVLISY